MLLLTRKINEAIVIDKKIKIKILEISEGQVKLGFEAPDEVKIYRMELFDQIEKQNIEAAQVSKSSVVQAAKMIKRNPLKNVK